MEGAKKPKGSPTPVRRHNRIDTYDQYPPAAVASLLQLLAPCQSQVAAAPSRLPTPPRQQPGACWQAHRGALSCLLQLQHAHKVA